MSKLKQKQNINNKKVPPKQITNEKDDNFEEELNWCLLQLGIEKKKKKFNIRFILVEELGQKRPDADADQIKESQGVVNKLKSNKTTKIEKRFIMQRTFGDYRKVKLK